MIILIADDEPIVLDSCRLVLEAEGFQVITLSSADEALRVIEEEGPDLLLVDIKMPVHDGMFLMEKVKNAYANIPVILMSGYATPEVVKESTERGAAVFLEKPFTPSELLETVRGVINKEE